jgi:hypothetical protein
LEHSGKRDVGIYSGKASDKAAVSFWFVHKPTGEKCAVGTILPGKTDTCERRVRAGLHPQIESDRLWVVHQPEGWTDAVIAKGSVPRAVEDWGLKDLLWDALARTPAMKRGRRLSGSTSIFILSQLA